MNINTRTKLIAALVLVLLLAWELLIEREAHIALDGFGFYAWFGFGACLALVVIALLVGRILKRGDDYYDD